jgi:hypothetical protein
MACRITEDAFYQGNIAAGVRIKTVIRNTLFYFIADRTETTRGERKRTWSVAIWNPRGRRRSEMKLSSVVPMGFVLLIDGLEPHAEARG